MVLLTLFIYTKINVVNNIKFNTFDVQFEKFVEKNFNNATKSKHIKKISGIKNDKIKRSLLELNKLFKIK